MKMVRKKIENEEASSPHLKKLQKDLEKIRKGEKYLEIEKKKIMKDKEIIRSKIKKEKKILGLQKQIGRMRNRKK